MAIQSGLVTLVVTSISPSLSVFLVIMFQRLRAVFYTAILTNLLHRFLDTRFRSSTCSPEAQRAGDRRHSRTFNR